MCYWQNNTKPETAQATSDKFQNLSLCFTKSAMNSAIELPVFKEAPGASAAL